MTEMDGVRLQRLDLLQRTRPVATVFMLAGPRAEVGLVGIAVDVRGVGGIADHHRRAVRGVDEHALVPDCVPRRGDHTHALGDLRIAVEQLEAGTRKVEPL